MPGTIVTSACLGRPGGTFPPAAGGYAPAIATDPLSDGETARQPEY